MHDQETHLQIQFKGFSVNLKCFISFINVCFSLYYHQVACRLPESVQQNLALKLSYVRHPKELHVLFDRRTRTCTHTK